MNDLNPAVEKTRAALRKIVREWELLHSHPFIPEVTLVQGDALIELKAGKTSIQEISQALFLDQSSASRLVGRLVRNGWVSRRFASDDKRRSKLKLTQSGERILRELEICSNNFAAAALEKLEVDDRVLVTKGLKLYSEALSLVRLQSGFEIRLIKPSDNRAIASIIRLVMSEFGVSGPGFAQHDKEVGEMSQTYCRPYHCYYVVTYHGKVVGGAGIAPLQGAGRKICELRKMYFLPAARGRRLGEKVLKMCLLKARKMGFHQCYLETISKMHQAQALYLKFGFTHLRTPLGDTEHYSCNRWHLKDLAAYEREPKV